MSKVLKLDFETADLKIKGEPPENKPPAAVELTRRIICNFIYWYAEQHGGLIKIERNQAYWLQNHLKEASEQNLKELEIPDDVFGFVRKLFRETRANPDKVTEIVEANVDAVHMG